MKKLLLFICIPMSMNNVNAQLSQTDYHVRSKVTVGNVDNQLTKLIIILPLAQSNQYQTVSNLSIYGGIIADIPETDDTYIRWTFTSDLPAAGESKETFYDFDVRLNSVNFDFSQVTTIYPYNTSSDTYLWYTGTSGVYVDPYNPTIQNIGDSLWLLSSDIVDYARRCYEYVAANYLYLNPNTGIHPLQDILNAGGGDCGNLTSIYVSLLRHKNIPSRHVVTVRPDNSYHVWADFYLENYGWVPVDVTYKNINPSGDFFGKYDGNGIIMTKEVWLFMDRGDGYTYYDVSLQNFDWWYWYSSGGNNISSSYNLSSTAFSGVQDLEGTSDISIYPNPSSDEITIEDFAIPTTGEGMIFIYELQGQLMFQQSIVQEKPVIDISFLKKGIYFVKIRDAKKTRTEKLVIH